MVRGLRQLGKRRYIGDSRTRIVHDRWHADCPECGVRDVARDGYAVGFEPDTLDGALWAGYEYCETCIDSTEPSPPRWARAKAADRESGHARKTGKPVAQIPREEHEPMHRQALSPERDELEVKG
jgi:hypothetical protein